MAAALQSVGSMDSNQTPKTAEGAGPRILLVDDEWAILRPTADYFRRLGAHVEVASEAEEAQALLTHRSYDLVILDVCLTPYVGSQGLNVLREIRHRNPHANVIVLSGLEGADIKEAARQQGADMVLGKPQRLSELAELAFQMTGRGHA